MQPSRHCVFDGWFNLFSLIVHAKQMCSLTQPASLNRPSTPHSSLLLLNLRSWHINDILYLTSSTFVQSMEDSSFSKYSLSYVVECSGNAKQCCTGGPLFDPDLDQTFCAMRHGTKSNVKYDVCIRQCSPYI